MKIAQTLEDKEEATLADMREALLAGLQGVQAFGGAESWGKNDG